MALTPVPTRTRIRVTHRNPPSNPVFPCPLITDANFNYICQAGGEMYLGSTVAVEAESWTRVRNLYR